jgi:glycosyltransferase involved in cell wall biosynthesis
MKIMFIIRSLNVGGAERQLICLAKGLNKSGTDISTAVFYRNGALERELQQADIPIIDLRKSGRWDILQFYFRLFTLTKKVAPDIIYGFLGTANILTILLKPCFKQIKMVWGVRASNVNLDHYDWMSRASYRIERWLSRFADLIICNSHAGKDYLVRCSFPENKTIVIPNGIDTVRFRPDMKACKRMRAKWGIANDEILVGLVGRLDPMKGHSTFLKSAAMLSRENKSVRFICVGDGPETYKSKIHSLSSELGLDGRIIWIGALSDMPIVYNALDVAVSSSSFGEGFTNVIGEAMACGVPCVVTDVGDSAWIVGKTGIVVPSGNPQALSEALMRLIALSAEQRRALGAHARDRIVSKFGVDALVARTVQSLGLT